MVTAISGKALGCPGDLRDRPGAAATCPEAPDLDAVRGAAEVARSVAAALPEPAPCTPEKPAEEVKRIARAHPWVRAVAAEEVKRIAPAYPWVRAVAAAKVHPRAVWVATVSRGAWAAAPQNNGNNRTVDSSSTVGSENIIAGCNTGRKHRVDTSSQPQGNRCNTLGLHKHNNHSRWGIRRNPHPPREASRP